MFFFQGMAKEWQNVFYMMACVYVFGAITFTIFARGETQERAVIENQRHAESSTGRIKTGMSSSEHLQAEEMDLITAC